MDDPQDDFGEIPLTEACGTKLYFHQYVLVVATRWYLPVIIMLMQPDDSFVWKISKLRPNQLVDLDTAGKAPQV